MFAAAIALAISLRPIGNLLVTLNTGSGCSIGLKLGNAAGTFNITSCATIGTDDFDVSFVICTGGSIDSLANSTGAVGVVCTNWAAIFC